MHKIIWETRRGKQLLNRRAKGAIGNIGMKFERKLLKFTEYKEGEKWK